MPIEVKPKFQCTACQQHYDLQAEAMQCSITCAFIESFAATTEKNESELWRPPPLQIFPNWSMADKKEFAKRVMYALQKAESLRIKQNGDQVKKDWSAA